MQHANNLTLLMKVFFIPHINLGTIFWCKVKNFFPNKQVNSKIFCIFAADLLSHRMKILFITPWYPTATDSMSGLFVEKIVQETTRRGADCRVIFSTSLLNMLNEAAALTKVWGKPDLIHLHVVTKQGLLPLLMKRFHGIPYIVTEHWSGYLEENGDYQRRCSRPVVGAIYRWFTRRVITRADAVTAVSDLLKAKMRICGLDNPDFRVIHNVVDSVFTPDGNIPPAEPMSFLHVSCFTDRAKNVTGIIEAARMLNERGVEFTLTMVGDGPDWQATKELSDRYGLETKVRFRGVLQSDEVAREMQRHQCLILFSNFETAAVVLQEAMSMGMRIISTPVGIAHEYKERIRIVRAGDIRGLAKAMQNVNRISDNRIISFSDVGEEYYTLYKEIIKKI